MNITLQTKPYREVMQWLTGVVPKKPPKVSIFTHARVVNAERVVLITATDGTCWLRAFLDKDSGAHSCGATNLPAKAFAELFKEGELLKIQGELLKIQSGEWGAANVKVDDRLNVVLPTKSGDDTKLLKRPAFTADLSFTVPSAALAEGLRDVEGAMSVDDSRYVLTGVLFHLIGSTLAMVATDGRRLHQCRVGPVDVTRRPEKDDIEFILPRSTVPHLRGLLKLQPKHSKAHPITIEAAGTMVRFIGLNVRLTSKLIEGTYPNYRNVVESQIKCVNTAFTVPVHDMLAALRAIARAAEHVTLHIAANKVLLSAYSKGNIHNNTTTTVNIIYTYTYFNAYTSTYKVQYLIDALTPHQRAEYPVVFHFNINGLDLCVITTPRTTMPIMPYRTT